MMPETARDEGGPLSPKGPAEPAVEKVADEVERTSPEGRPARAEMKPWRFGMIGLGFLVAALTLALVLGMFVHPLAGVGIGLVAVMMIFFNPMIWVGGMREKEREDAQQHVADREPQLMGPRVNGRSPGPTAR
ncbi:MAG: hypothetical protein SFZ24_09315 [Planctomycetota bacterium]|nr:hypothetical protein [Planctomycetota bacterium]